METQGGKCSEAEAVPLHPFAWRYSMPRYAVLRDKRDEEDPGVLVRLWSQQQKLREKKALQPTDFTSAVHAERERPTKPSQGTPT